MAEVLAFHHAHGPTPGFLAFADELRDAGHRVHTPDLYDGRTFARLADGVAYAESIGTAEIIARGVRAAGTLPPALVYIGFSLGALPAQKLAQTRAGARGAVLCHACIPVSEFGAAWPAGVPVQIHAMDRDPTFINEGDLGNAQALVAAAPAEAALFLYPGARHLFTDHGLADHDAAAAALLTRRVLDFLAVL